LSGFFFALRWILISKAVMLRILLL
jgi:hypothetical protein